MGPGDPHRSHGRVPVHQISGESDARHGGRGDRQHGVVTGQVAIPCASEYVAAKHGVVGLTRAAGGDYGARGIRVNAVLPGIIKTPLIERLMGNHLLRH